MEWEMYVRYFEKLFGLPLCALTSWKTFCSSLLGQLSAHLYLQKNMELYFLKKETENCKSQKISFSFSRTSTTPL